MIKNKSKFLFIAALFLIIFTAQSVMAEDVDQAALSEIDDSSLGDIKEVSADDGALSTDDSSLGDIEEVSADDDALSTDSSDDKLSEDEPGTFSDLKQLIDDTEANGILELTKDYKYDPSSDSAYSGGIEITKPIDIRGNGHKIDGDNQAKMFYMFQEFSKYKFFRNITFVNGYSSGNGGAIECWGWYLYIYDCTFKNNHAYDGGAVYMWHGAVKNCVFEDNIADGDGGALNTDYQTVQVLNSVFNNNNAAASGGAIESHKKLVVDNSKFNGNTAKFMGGAIEGNDQTTITNSEFNSNSVSAFGTSHGGAIALDNSGANSQISQSNFTGNEGRDGGAIYVEQNNAIVKDSKFDKNHALNVNGGAINWANDNGAIEACEFSDNTADNDGGAVYISSSNNVSISKSSFSENVAYNCGADINSQLGKNISITSSTFTHDGDKSYENIFLNQAECANISDCEIKGRLSGIVVENSQDVTLEGNTIETTADYAIDSFETDGSVKDNQLKAGDNVGDDAMRIDGGEVTTEGNTKILADPNLQASAEAVRDTITITATTQATGKVTVKVLDAAGNVVASEEVDIVDGNAVFTKPGFADGDYNYTVEFAQDADFNAAIVNGTVKVENTKQDPNLQASAEANLDKDTLTMFVTVTTSTAATGKVNVSFYDNNDNILVSENVEIKDGKAVFIEPYLADGVYKYTVKFDENDDYLAGQVNGTVTVKDPRNATTLNVDAKVSFDMKTLVNTVVITTSSNINGNVTVTLYLADGTVEVAENVTLVNGKATFTEPFLSAGKYSYAVEFFGDLNNKQTYKTGSLTIKKHTTTFTPKTSKVDYGFTYKVLVKIDGKAVGAGKEIVLKIAGKTLKAKTDKNGYATFKLAVKPKKYSATLYMNKVKAEFKGTKKVSVTVKNVIKAKNAKVKKSAKKLKIKATLKTSAKKPIKGKKVTLKIKGKKIKATTNKKGVATFKVKKSILKKLKAGKKYKFQIVYGKDIVKKTLKVKK